MALITLAIELSKFKTYIKSTQYYHIEQLDCYCRVDRFEKQDLFIDVNGDTVAIVKRK
jgi:hypothetical protein